MVDLRNSCELLIQLYAWCQNQNGNNNWVIAYSGGLDSHVLLHACHSIIQEHKLPVKLRAVHVDHQWQPNSYLWRYHCAAICEALQIPFTALVVDSKPDKKESSEAWARNARYALLKQNVQAYEILLTAHHNEDQAETFLLQALRGAGPKGLAAMPLWKIFGNSELHRPLINCAKKAFEDYAKRFQLKWIEDPSNQNDKFLRNYIRSAILPLLKQRFPNVTTSLVRSAKHCAEALGLLEKLAHEDLKEAVCVTTKALKQDKVLALTPERQKNVIRHWIATQKYPLPQSQRLHTFIEQLRASQDKQPDIDLGTFRVRRFKNHWSIYTEIHQSANYQILWQKEEILQLPNRWILSIQSQMGQGIKFSPDSTLVIKNRSGGEICRPVNYPHSKTLKKWFQIYQIPPWQRNEWPLIYINHTLAMIPGLFICEGFQANASDPALIITLNNGFKD